MVWALVAGGMVLGAALSDGRPGRAGADVSGEDVGPPPARERRAIDAIGVPLLSYNSDLGWGIGLVGGVYVYAPGYEPYRHALAAQAFITSEGARNHWVRYDGPSLIWNLRLEVRGEYRRELYAPFYGAGNLAGAGADIRANARAWSFDYFLRGGWVRLRARPFDGARSVEVYGGYGFHHVRVMPYAASALEELSPPGVRGGAHGQALLGALWDTRDHETDPTAGGLEEIAFRFSAAPTGSRYEYVGVTIGVRRYWSLGTPRLIFAQRVIADVLSSDAPFFEWMRFGGTAGGEGIGGMSSVRGVRRNRYQGTAKVVSNSELRFYVWDFPLLGEAVKTGGVAYIDLGRVWHPGVEDGSLLNWHPGVGTGLRVVRRAAVARFDLALSPELWRPGIYVTFGHLF
jgi:hypothetical protein